MVLNKNNNTFSDQQKTVGYLKIKYIYFQIKVHNFLIPLPPKNQHSSFKMHHPIKMCVTAIKNAKNLEAVESFINVLLY